ncbi:hypothetical protein [Methylobacterium nonmethylotrophicum]|uniref:YubB ferredoxin-like domain-containing protein n=1 Tax=Methylobacterium nonmethylotrophicum TaxID=1141884 RepID=A0A4Z0NTH1_9HYPH|nr:hypothetical protein [Methylobacterium nonmethylotrophicum]TGD99447.1 hypothetical protein EU555_13165 [Methylobacterium nonmethylotrophicum]
MTNHVTTCCTVRGPSADVAAFRALMVVDAPLRTAPAAGLMARLRALTRRTAPDPGPAPASAALDFNRILPMPRTLAEGPEQAAWALEHWGTQRNAEYYEETAWSGDGAGGASLAFRLSTAWSFPAPVFEALQRRFPALRIDVVGFEEAWHFAVEGTYGPGATGAAEVEPTAALYTRVYGVPPDPDEER